MPNQRAVIEIFHIENCSQTVNKKNISNTMNSFFCSVGKDLADKIDSSPNPLLSGDYEVKKIRHNFALRQLRSKRSGMHLPQSKQQRALGLTTSLATF